MTAGTTAGAAATTATAVAGSTPATARTPEPVNAARVSGLGSRVARWALLYVAATGAAQTLLLWDTFARPWLLVVALGATAAASVLLSLPADDPLPLAATVAVAALPVVNAVLLLPQLDPAHPERAWAFAIGCYFGGLLEVRGRPVAAWCGGVVALALVLVWAHRHHATGEQTAAVAGLALGAYLVGALWRRMLNRHVATIRAHRGEEVRAAVEEAATRAAVAASSAELRTIGAEAQSLLERIGAGGVLDDRERADARLLEARLRDRIRARALAQEPVVGACDRARRHGTDVLLLDDGAGVRTLPAPVLQRIAGLIAPVTDGRVTVRVLPPGRDALVTVLVDHAGRVSAEALSATGTIVRSADPQF
ncbi:MAG TPA: hypothetical protein VGC04_02500 [Cellulomonas sp.]